MCLKNGPVDPSVPGRLSPALRTAGDRPAGPAVRRRRRRRRRAKPTNEGFTVKGCRARARARAAGYVTRRAGPPSYVITRSPYRTGRGGPREMQIRFTPDISVRGDARVLRIYVRYAHALSRVVDARRERSGTERRSFVRSIKESATWTRRAARPRSDRLSPRRSRISRRIIRRPSELARERRPTLAFPTTTPAITGFISPSPRNIFARVIMARSGQRAGAAPRSAAQLIRGGIGKSGRRGEAECGIVRPAATAM